VSRRFVRITAAVLAVFFLVGFLPYCINHFFHSGKSQGLQVRLLVSADVIKNIELEEYLIGVVAAEMPAEFESEALKAQSIAARTYVLKKIDTNNGNSYDVDITEKTQAWNSNTDMFKKWGVVNYYKYRSKIAHAVNGTRGIILTYNGQKIDAVYHSSSGRKDTERAGDVWQSDTGYLTSVASGESNTLRFVKHQIFDVENFYDLLGFSQTPARFSESDLILIDRTKAGRIKNVAIRNKVFKGTELRTKLLLPSTDFEWKIQGSKIEFISYGKGHGVGMSQYGANDLAKSGNDYAKILRHYYPGTKMEKVN